jgi:hypothetical protein
VQYYIEVMLESGRLRRVGPFPDRSSMLKWHYKVLEKELAKKTTSYEMHSPEATNNPEWWKT